MLTDKTVSEPCKFLKNYPQKMYALIVFDCIKYLFLKLKASATWCVGYSSKWPKWEYLWSAESRTLSCAISADLAAEQLAALQRAMQLAVLLHCFK